MDIEHSDDGLDEVSGRRLFREHQWDTLVAIAVGGCLGAEARYGVGRWLHHNNHQFPTSTLLINVSGSLLIGVLLAIVHVRGPHRLLRPFAGVGILGGYTTFSTFAVDTDQLIGGHRVGLALGYLISSTVACLIAVYLGWRGTTLAITPRTSSSNVDPA